ncbi:hypothetical protein FB390_4981 [Nocardia bhagyanarayanae]|uniref:Uncharacterized protein n=2 Tax=Nocardia bhagyanarayanae TaxID=1215925 RepID=A0A543FHB5_9NOCA|nr:hypothetical protein FB390_4981 [Nocardia bhagyanarayanae]
MVGNTGAHAVQAGTVVIITEGARQVGYFHVTEVLDATPPDE